MLKNVYFRKSCKIAAVSGDLPPKILTGLQRLGTLPPDPCIATLTY